MSKIQFSFENLNQINFSLYEDNFTILFNNSKSLKIPSFIAEFISPEISKIRLQDPTITRYKINLNPNEDTMGKLVQLLHGETMEIDGNGEITQILIELKNKTIIKSCLKELSVDNVYEQLTLKKNLSINIDQEIDFSAEHFEEIKEKNFSFDDWISILNSEKLKLKNEKSLLDFIINKMNTESRYYILLKYLHCEFLKKEDLQSFVLLIDKFDVNQIGTLWPALRNQFIANKESLQNRHIEPFNVVNIPFDGSNYFNGIFDHLTKKNNGNIVDNGIIEATSSSLNSSPYKINNIFHDSGDFGTKNEHGSWFLLNFKSQKVKIEKYSMRTVSNNWANEYLKSWKLEGSNDLNGNWTIIDQQVNTSYFNSHLQTRIFDAKFLCGPFQYIKLTQTGQNYNNTNYLALNRLELFGELY